MIASLPVAWVFGEQVTLLHHAARPRGMVYGRCLVCSGSWLRCAGVGRSSVIVVSVVPCVGRVFACARVRPGNGHVGCFRSGFHSVLIRVPILARGLIRTSAQHNHTPNKEPFESARMFLYLVCGCVWWAYGKLSSGQVGTVPVGGCPYGSGMGLRIPRARAISGGWKDSSLWCPPPNFSRGTVGVE